MLNLQYLQKEIRFIIFDLSKRCKKDIYISTIIANVKSIYPIGKKSIKKYIQKSLNITLQKNQKRLYIKNIKQLIRENEIIDERGFIIIEGLYFLYKNKIKRVDRNSLYNFYIYNSQLDIDNEAFNRYLSEFNIFKKRIFINRRLINKIVNRYNLNIDNLYNKSYIYKKEEM